MGIGSIEGSGNYFLGSKTLTVGGNNAPTTVSGVIQDGGSFGGAGGSLTKVGTGTLTLTGTNTYTGITTINDGVLSISQDANLGTPPGTLMVDQLTFNGGTLQATASFTLNPNRGVTLNEDGTFDVTDANVLTIAGAITGPSSLTKIDTGTLILSGVNTYTGITSLNGGVLTISQDANLGMAPTHPVTNKLTFDFGTLEATASFTLNPNRGVTLMGTNDTISVTGANVLTYGGIITGPGSLLKGDSGTLILSGVNTYTGITTINAGVLSISQDANLGTPPGTPVGNQLTFNGGTLQATASFALNPNRGVTLNAGGTFDVTGANVLTYGGVLTGPGNLTKLGMGTFTLTGANTYTGGTNLNAGILAVNSDANLGTGPLSFNGGILEALTAGTGINSTKAVTLNAGGGTFLADPATTSTLGGPISGVGSLTKAGIGTLVLAGNNTYTGGTTVSAGTLQLGNGGTTGSISGDIIDNSVLIFDRSDSFTFGGVISGSGSVVDLGTGKLTFTGNNIYTGGTTISAGTLQLGNGGTTGSITGNVTDNSVLAFNRSDPVTFGGVISGTGSLVDLSTGKLTLTGSNTFTGGTTISAGTLQIGNGGTAGSIAGNVTDNSVLAFNRSDSVTFGGVISGTGSLVDLGTGTLTLTGANTYTGGTIVNAGTLQAGSATGFSPNSEFTVNSILDLHGFNNTIGSLSGSGTVLNNGGTAAALTVGTDNASTNFNGVLENGTSVLQLTKSGLGTLTLTGANTYTGTTTVNSGSLIVDGSIASAATVVNAGGFLGGHGTIGGVLVNNGIVGQVSSPGTLTVASNFTQNAGGTLRIGVAGVAPGQHDLLAVNGHAALAGTVQFFSLGGFNLQPGNQLTFLTAKDGISGEFGTVQNNFGTIVHIAVNSLPGAVVLEGVQGSFTQLGGLTPNEGAVAKMLDSAAGDPRAAPLFQFLNSQPLSSLPHDLSLISPAQISSFHATGAAHGNTQIANLGGRMANIRAGLTGFSSLGFTLNGGVASSGEGFAGVSGPEGKSGPSVLAPTPDNRWGVFVTGIGEFTNVDSTPNAVGYDIDTGGVTFGVDYRVCPFLAIGLSAGYAHTKVNIDSDGGHIDVSSGKFGLYATAFTQGFYVDAAVNGGPSGYKSHRTALQGTATG